MLRSSLINRSAAIAIALAAAGVAGFVFTSRAQEPTTPPTTAPASQPAMSDEELGKKAGYMVGNDVGQSLARLPVKLDFEAVLAGMKDGASNAAPKYSQQEMMDVMRLMQAKTEAEQERVAIESAKPNLAAGEKFLAENKTKPGITTTASGLQFQTLVEGTGDSPKPSDQVRVHYTGRLLDGTVFDSSREGPQPAPITFPLDGVIPGWTEGLQLMKKGGKATLWIPSNLGYGDQGSGPIPPGSTLEFEVELVDINPPADVAPPAMPPK